MDGQKQTWINRLHMWALAHKSGLLFAAALAIIIGSGLTVLAFTYQQPVAQQSTVYIPKKPKPDPVFYSPLTGVPLADEAATKRPVTAIMIENSPDARPQSGLKAAGIVYEAIAEGGITRFLTLHQEDRPSLIGPVRSLRPYYVDWLSPFDASVAHVGGSKKALDEIRNGTHKDIDQFFNGKYYWRATDRAAPHNVYTSFDKLDELNQAKGYTSSTFTPFVRKDDKASTQPNATSINVTISSNTYNSSYTYDKTTNSYLRSEGGAAHNDREAGQITPKTVIVIKVQTILGFEDGWREQMTTTGSGQAYIFQDGTAAEGTWQKSDMRAQIQFLDATGRPIALNRGQTWITAIPTNRSVTWQ